MFKSTALDAKESLAVIGGALWDDTHKQGPYGLCHRKVSGTITNGNYGDNVTFGPWKRYDKRKDGSYKDCNEK
ncbi:Uncharacterised protein [Cedecea neteri]|uniref:Uncharacterized protein n=1 Tax=Cedecea neteri TaxID=158822 RepID=A0A291DSA2_9ENTR|nr:hypothetical protein [Cedecea neteri]ATF90589.1 hypothetical protein CO704_00090 [Cedecea neteri]SQA98795.1 Uncharacterised protein [Cedecea neteri]